MSILPIRCFSPAVITYMAINKIGQMRNYYESALVYGLNE